jgi:hypothetical protein
MAGSFYVAIAVVLLPMIMVALVAFVRDKFNKNGHRPKGIPRG